MARIVLIHWKPAEAEPRMAALCACRHEVSILLPRGSADLRPLRENPPELFVIDMTRLPSQGCAVAIELRRQKGTRTVPIVFAGGETEKVARARALLPDAEFAVWSEVEDAVRRSLGRPLTQLAVPGTMAGYAGTPLVKKLGIRAGAVVALLGASKGFQDHLGELPEAVRVRTDARAAADLILLFVESLAALKRCFPAASGALKTRGAIWIAWPKQASGVPTDLTEREVRRFGMAAGFVDYKICAIDATWSGLLFTRRRAAGAGRSPNA